MRIVVAVLVFMHCTLNAVGQQPLTPGSYDVEDAYKIYSLLIPQEESYGIATGKLVIQEETVSIPVTESTTPEACLTADAVTFYKDAIADYKRVNRKKWLLQPRLQIAKPYEIVKSDAIRTVFQNGNWEGFRKRYPDSGGYIILSAVGFNGDKTRALVYTGSSCGGLCGRWSLHLLQKIDGQWKETPGVSCMTVSQLVA